MASAGKMKFVTEFVVKVECEVDFTNDQSIQGIDQEMRRVASAVRSDVQGVLTMENVSIGQHRIVKRQIVDPED